ncbi:MAG: hypothetical protein RL338_1294 [Chloroflexota bacterium]
MQHPIVASDMDGTLATAETWRAVLAWIRLEHPSPAARRFVALRLPLVIAAKAGVYEKEAFRSRWLEDEARLLRDLPERRLADLGRWVVEERLWPTRREPALAAVAAALREARAADPASELVLASGAFQPVADAFAARIGASVALGTPLEVRDERLTGRLTAPVGSGERKAAAIRELAGDAPIVAAFGDTVGDIPFLALATRAVAVAPDAGLRAAATARGWEILPG